MDVNDTHQPEVVPGLGCVTWSSDDERLTVAEGFLQAHRPVPRGLTDILLWPLTWTPRTCERCGAAYPCNRAAWALNALDEMRRARPR